ncbi:hypothetical protein HNQ36_002687 [Afipia massiliensis]|uniref:site-specific DNA-methyltransferase (adenine-specific) n=1 Tax=Afipia massiliensis TaxID=211460 RepID=A0A840MXV6_9BRAD|nr:class I SAM-dependent DNA methyltransferase [Afipia massiliensis]MBB5052713.1 hypothetical protein [Afipia massiliensis]
MNIAEIEIQLSDLVEQPFNADEFVYRLLEIYNAPKATLTKLRKGTQNKGERPGDLLWARKIYFRPTAKGQVAQTLDGLKDLKATKSQKPRFLFATDGQEVSTLDLKTDETLHFDFAELNDHFDFFLPLAGIDKYEAVKENPADIKATGRLAKFHDEIVRYNPDWTTDEKRHALNQFMTRILFCMFAEDTGSFARDLFVKTITEFGGDDGEHLQSLLRQIFDVMNVADSQRGSVPAHVKAFPYVNGGLFAESSDIPAFNRRARRILIEAAQLDWREINPDIFGSMIQAIVHPDMRGDLGMHYTSVPNIMKVLQPLFLTSLEEEFAEAHRHREERSRLTKLLARISKIRVFDPACGSGNFLIIAYRELRTLEMRVFKRLEELDEGQRSHRWTSVKLSNFYGIELADFAAETAKLSLWISEYQMNQRFKDMFGEAPPNFPLHEGGSIVCGNALSLNWTDACPPTVNTPKSTAAIPAHIALATDVHTETYIVGNPPYQGARKQTPSQKLDLETLFSGHADFKDADYVIGWFIKAGEYLSSVNAQFAFVTTNSVSQGEQVGYIWRRLFERNLEIAFAHTSFNWSNSARENAGVHCVIIGVRHRGGKVVKRINDGFTQRVVKNISPYLIEGDDIFASPMKVPISPQLPKMVSGNMPRDGGHLLLSSEEATQLIRQFEDSKPLIRKLMGTQEFTLGEERWCLWIEDKDFALACSIPPIKERIEKVRQFRSASSAKTTQAYASIPYKFAQRCHKDIDAIIVPKLTTDARGFVTPGFLDGSVIVTDLAFAIFDAQPFVFSILCSSLHAAWARTVSGRFRVGIRYSSNISYNTFPAPELTGTQISALDELAWAIISARDQYPGKTIAWLYDPDTMPKRLLDAHRSLDETLEKIYIGRPFKSDTERLEHLFKLYAEMTADKVKEAANA